MQVGERTSALLLSMVTDVPPAPDLSDGLKVVRELRLGKGIPLRFRPVACGDFLWRAATSDREKVQGANRRSRTFLTANKITNVETLPNALRGRLHMEPTEASPLSVIVG